MNVAVPHEVCLSYSDLSFWCYACDSYVTTDALAAIRKVFEKAKFGAGPGEGGEAGEGVVGAAVGGGVKVVLDAQSTLAAEIRASGEQQECVVPEGAGGATSSGGAASSSGGAASSSGGAAGPSSS